MTKADERADVVKAEADAEKVFQEGQRRQLADTPAGIPVLFGNENYVSDRRPRVKSQHTQEEWLAEATEIKTVLERGDRVSYQTVEMLFLDAYDVIEGFVPAGTRGGKKKENEDDSRRENAKRES